MSVKGAASEILEDFELFDDWEDKYEYLISLGKELEEMPQADKVDDNLVKGCQSRVWLSAKKEGDKVVYFADSDAIISKGIIALLVKILSNQPAKEVAGDDFSFIDQIGLKEHLSPNRSNGLVGMMKKMKTFALAFSQ